MQLTNLLSIFLFKIIHLPINDIEIEAENATIRKLAACIKHIKTCRALQKKRINRQLQQSGKRSLTIKLLRSVNNIINIIRKKILKPEWNSLHK